MKTKNLFGLLGLILLFGCEKEDLSYVYPKNAKLKRIEAYSPFVNKTSSMAYEYEYDKNRISKVSLSMYENGEKTYISNYEIYNYNTQGELIKIENFHFNSGFTHNMNTIYTYLSNGKIEKKYIEHLQTNTFDYYLYKYENGYLSKIEKYWDSDILGGYVKNDYDRSGNLIKETSYGKDNTQYSYTQHTYKNGLNIKSEIFSDTENKAPFREILRTYDKNGNLIILESNELSLVSSNASYVLRYEYFEE